MLNDWKVNPFKPYPANPYPVVDYAHCVSHADKCRDCYFLREERDMNALIPYCARENDFSLGVQRVENQAECKGKVTNKKIQELVREYQENR